MMRCEVFPIGKKEIVLRYAKDLSEDRIASAMATARSMLGVGGQPYLPAGGHEEDSLAITERYRIR